MRPRRATSTKIQRESSRAVLVGGHLSESKREADALRLPAAARVSENAFARQRAHTPSLAEGSE
jgi:hypothetical protein